MQGENTIKMHTDTILASCKRIKKAAEHLRNMALNNVSYDADFNTKTQEETLEVIRHENRFIATTLSTLTHAIDHQKLTIKNKEAKQ